ncbi:hypothetical protein [Microlunatus sp. Y2014]|uniref:hypothetical protein n=1 Tax=Microlunatus sp. Y2014 TaxID=3418488 RepID=UPI003DA76A4C
MDLACDVCGSAFTGRTDARYCSGRCRTMGYRRRHSKGKPMRRIPLPDAFFHANYDLQKIAERLGRLVADDRFPRNRPNLAHERRHLVRTRDAIEQVLADWPE